ncbi:Uncharacterised protein [Bordetella pertussis]|nr:Uncharacterised protein [Bordetella pertussis]
MRRMRTASPMRDSLPCESSSTMAMSRPLMRASMTRHSPASLMKPVFETLMSQSGLRTSRLVLRNVWVRLLISTSYSVSVE